MIILFIKKYRLINYKIIIFILIIIIKDNKYIGNSLYVIHYIWLIWFMFSTAHI